ncbi:uncharacterized protein MELLADRAFT_108314 [Melampsora larici-populina 98AG31]|uniref:Uncharacterized protein n=1 Tax=Melampsora larici-populina (strain 98AG31 / pathotype 3-4-7) TaxID=747676 RepID=F4RSP4_MELLP|nr:uncharacterized protein MELLADRAFT_108314 [Melampsora larici-populina 98AG31]EGG04636.1 hypothetical protein MELLADRAFT_108314 [Melampsora larici-populina 98AG31]
MDHSNYFDRLAAGSSNQSHNVYHLNKTDYNSSQSLDSNSKSSYAESQFKSNSLNQPSEPDIKGNPSIGRSSYSTENQDCDIKEDSHEGFKSMISDSKKFKLDLSFNRIENLNDQLQCKSPKSLNSNQKQHQDQDLLPTLPVSPLPLLSIKNDKPINSKELKKIYSNWEFPIRTDSPRGLTWGPFKDESKIKPVRTRSQHQTSRKIYVILKPLNENRNQTQTGEEEIEKEIKLESEGSGSNLIQKDLVEINSTEKPIKPEIIITSTPNHHHDHHPTLKSKKSKRTFEIETELESQLETNHKRIKPFHDEKKEELNQHLGFCLPDYLLFLDPIQIIKTNHRIIKDQELMDIEIKA